MLKKLFLILAVFSIIVILLILFYIYILGDEYNGPNQKAIERKEIYIDSLENGIIIEEPHLWITNNFIMQYSSKAVIKWGNEVMLEAIVFCEYEQQTDIHIRSRVKFLVNLDGKCMTLDVKEVYAKDTQIQVDKVTRFIWKLRTTLKLNYSRLKKLAFLVTDFEEYQKTSSAEDSLLIFHKPIIYDSRLRKSKAVAHCVHQVRGLADVKMASNLKMWLRLQRDLGIDKVKMYFQEDTSIGRRVLEEFMTDKFVEIVDYKFNMSKLCKHQLNHQLKMPNETNANNSLKLCEHLFSIYFGQGWAPFHTGEMTATNDCFTNFKYTHEYVTNYDFDELLFPRIYSTKDLLTIAADLRCDRSSSTTTQTYNIYNYANRLFEIHRRLHSKKKIGALHFEHLLFVDRVDKTFLANLTAAFIENATTKWSRFFYGENSLNIKIDKNETNREAVSKSIALIECLNKTMGEETNLIKWNRAYAIWIDVRHGKSIYDTNLTEFINQHYAESLSSNAIWVSVPIDQGFSSHFRDPVDNNFFIGQNYTLTRNFRIDLEYYYFLSKHASRRYRSYAKNFFF